MSIKDKNKRRLDRVGEDWPDAYVNRGIENRFLVAAPGNELKLREGTEDIIFDPIRLITWKQVLGVLCSEECGAVNKHPGYYEKLIEGFPFFEGTGNPHDLRTFISHCVEINLNQCNLAEEENDIRFFISQRMTEILRRKHLQQDIKDFSPFAADFAYEIAPFLMANIPFPEEESDFTRFYDHLMTQVKDIISRYTNSEYEQEILLQAWDTVYKEILIHPSLS